jgi:hypothetical protein
MVIKNSLHQLVEELPEEELSTALRFLQYLRDMGGDPFVETVIREPDDDVLVADNQEASVADAWREYFDSRAGSGQPTA